MATLTYTDWMTELENAIVSHLDSTIPTDIAIYIESELPRSFTKPIITLTRTMGGRRPSGGMNHVGDSEQGFWELPNYSITVNTDDKTGKKTTRNQVAAELVDIAFGQKVYLLKTAVEATVVTIKPAGVYTGPGPTGDRLLYQKSYMLHIEVLVPRPSLVL